jgi:hypothetical protein
MNKLARDYGLPQHECNTSVLCPRRHELRVVLGSTYDPQAARAGEVAGAGTPAASRSLPRSAVRDHARGAETGSRRRGPERDAGYAALNSSRNSASSDSSIE